MENSAGLIAFAFFLAACSSKPTPVALNPELVRSYKFELESQKHLKAPYVAKYKKRSNTLWYLASEHISPRDYPDLLEHPTLKSISKILDGNKIQVVVVEGLDTGEELSPKSILKYADQCLAINYQSGCGESFFAINEARKRKIEYITGEPTHSHIRDEIIKAGFSVEDLLAFYLVRQIPQMKRQNSFSKQNFPEIAGEQLLRFQKMLKVDVKFSYPEFKTWYAKNMSKPKNFLDIENDDPAPNASSDATYIQKISNRVGLIRDKGIVLTIHKMLSQFRRVLVVYGGSHLITQEPAFVSAFGSPEYYRACCDSSSP